MEFQINGLYLYPLSQINDIIKDKKKPEIIPDRR